MNESQSGPGRVEARAAALGVEVPAPPEPKGAYLPGLVTGDLLFTSGMGPVAAGVRHHVGYVGADVTVEQAAEAARIAVLNAIGALRAAAGGDLDQVAQVVRLTGYVRSAHGFTGQTRVLDAASDLVVDLFGPAGRHARSAVGVAELPFGIPVEIELVARLRADAGRRTDRSSEEKQL